MMKLNVILIIVLAVFTSACQDDFLDTEILTQKTDANYYSTPEEANEALVGCYDGLHMIWSDGVAMPIAATTMSDLCFGSTGAGDGDGYPMMDEFDQSVSPGDENLFGPNWEDYYAAIFRCNKLIQAMNQNEWNGTEEERTRIIGEARFLRALLYFDMVRMFERIPLLTEPSIENIPQSEPDETYTVITEDLLFAIENVRATPYQDINPAEFGYATKWAAQSLLARVYLYYTGYYNQDDLVGMVTQNDALGYVEDVIDNSGHALVDTFAHLWPAASTYLAAEQGKSINDHNYAGEANPEVVFSIKYTYTSDYNGNTDGNHWMVMNGLRNQSVPEYGYGNGWGANSVVPEVYDNWDPDDSRREASIMAIEEEGIDFQEIDDTKEYTGYFTKKYTPRSDEEGNSLAENFGAPNFMIGQFQDYFVIRYADVLLMAAELGSPNAIDYVNQVRERAGVSTLDNADIDVIYEERRKEFAFEGIWYWDMLRRDHTLEYAANRVEYQGTVLNGGAEMTKTIDGQNLIKTRGLFQIPQDQITLSDGVLEQNPGWD